MNPLGPHTCPRCGRRETHITLAKNGPIPEDQKMNEFFDPPADLDDDLKCIICLKTSKRRAWRQAAGAPE